MKILLIEDEPELRKSIKQYLHQEGYLVESAPTLPKALKKPEFMIMIVFW
jgi:DNA-binding response OmpR family regulator